MVLCEKNPHLLLACFLLVVSNVAQAQWQWQNPLPQGNNLWGVEMLDDTTVVAVGNSGTIIRTTNAGLTWTFHSDIDLTTSNLLDVSFCQHGLGIAGGENGTLLRTSNGGISWQGVTTGIVQPIWKVKWIDCQRAVALSGGTLLKTSDAGVTWVQESMGGYGISFVSPDTGFIAGSAGTILRTTNGGGTWTPQQSGTNVDLWDVCFASNDTGIAVGGGYETQFPRVIRTTNGGMTWSSQPLSGIRPHRISLFDSRNGIIVGSHFNTNTVNIFHTTNAGESWTTYSTGSNRSLYGLSVTSAGIGTAVGEYGTIFRSENSGATWNLLTRVTTVDLNSVAFINRDRGIAVGNNGVILVTTNGGNVWTQRSIGIAQSFFAVAWANINKAYAVGSSGAVFRTSDGGETWISRNIPTTAWLSGLSFSNSNTCTVVSDSGIIFKTTNDGDSWQRQTSSSDTALTSVSFADSNAGIAVGWLGAVYVTSNGGSSWRKRQLPFLTIVLQAVQFTTARNAWAAGDGIYRTTDAGETWTRVSPTGSASGLHFINDNTGVVVGPAGFIYTTNGGGSWGAKYTGTSNYLRSISILEANDVIVAGVGGTILRTSSGLVGVPEYSRELGIPDQILLEQNYPNPFNPVTTIRFNLFSPTRRIQLNIHDILGRVIRTLEIHDPHLGSHEISWDGKNNFGKKVAAGVYIVTMHSSGTTQSKKMLLVK